MDSVFELSKSTLDDRSYILGRIGQLRCSFERLDSDTYNLTIPDNKDVDIFIEIAEDRNIAYCLL